MADFAPGRLFSFSTSSEVGGVGGSYSFFEKQPNAACLKQNRRRDHSFEGIMLSHLQEPITGRELLTCNGVTGQRARVTRKIQRVKNYKTL